MKQPLRGCIIWSVCSTSPRYAEVAAISAETRIPHLVVSRRVALAALALLAACHQPRTDALLPCAPGTVSRTPTQLTRAANLDSLLWQAQRGALVVHVRLDSGASDAQASVRLALSTEPARVHALDLAASPQSWALDSVPPGRYVFSYARQPQAGAGLTVISIRSGYRDRRTVTLPEGPECLLPSPHSA